MDNRHNYLPSNKSPYSFCCSDTSGKCRQKSTSFSLPDNSTIEDRQVFCMAFREDTSTHKFTGETSDRLWGKFISHDLSASLSHAWGKGNTRTNRPPIIKRPPRPKKRNFSHLLLVGDRHVQIKKLLAQLSLTPHHRQGLIERGFSDQQIEQYSFLRILWSSQLNPFP